MGNSQVFLGFDFKALSISKRFDTSSWKSNSSQIVSANNSTKAGGLVKAAIGIRPTNFGASHAITFRSLLT